MSFHVHSCRMPVEFGTKKRKANCLVLVQELPSRMPDRKSRSAASSNKDVRKKQRKCEKEW